LIHVDHVHHAERGQTHSQDEAKVFQKSHTVFLEILDFRNNENKTRLSTHINKLKQENNNYQLKWEILDRASTHSPVSRKCRLCLKEIYYIIFRPDSASLNSRNKLFNTCRVRHRTQQLLINA
jgi:hypothetical protein